jgi:uncharacterized iron-regulated membrane protein
MNRLTRFFRRLHNLLGLIVGAQVLLWVLSGLIFTIKPIEAVRGDPLRHSAPEMMTAVPDYLAPVDGILEAAGEPVMALKLKPWLGRAVWEADMPSGKALFDAETGAALSPVTEDDARRIAEAAWAGEGTLASLTLAEPAPREAGRGAGRAMWRAEFDGKDKATFWIDPQAGDVAAVRTAWWRTFDLFWGLHIMDWTSRETISTWWMKLFAFAALMLSVAGIWMVIDRTVKGRLLK